MTSHIAAYRGGTYDGNAGFQTRFDYSLGFASSADGSTWTKTAQILTAAGSGWETAHLTDPCLVDDSGTLYLFYAAAASGFDSDPERGSVLFTIGVATSTNRTTWTKHGQVLGLGGSGAWDEGNVRHPYVILDPGDANPAKRWKMWYSGQDGSYNYPKIGYAYSADGLTWTKDTHHLSPGTESTYGCISPVVVGASGTWYLYYAGITNPDSFLGGTGPLQSQLCLATFTDPESTYTKSGSNPLVTVPSPSPDDYRDVTATVAATATSLTVASATGYSTGDEFYIMQYGGSDSPAYCAAKVTSVVGSTINFTPPAPATHTVNHGAGHYVLIRKICLGSLEPRSIVEIAGEWILYCSVIGALIVQYDTGSPIEPAPPFSRAVAVTSSSLTSGWSIDHTRSLLLSLGTDTGPFGEHTFSGWDADEAAQLAYPSSPAGVPETFVLDFWTPVTDIQHVCANGTNVVVIADHYDPTLTHVSIDVAVFDLTGTLLNVWSHSTAAILGQFTGSCVDDTAVYFMYSDTDDTFAKVNLSTGTWTDLFTVPTVDAQVPSATFGTGIGRGIVEKDGDLIIAGTYGIARVQQDGTVVWWGDITDPLQSYRGLAHSGKSVWASQTTNTADEWSYDGTFLQSVSIPEFAIQAWLGP